MKKLSLLAIVLAATLGISSCAQTTATGTSGVSRTQVLLVSAEEMNAQAEKEYAQVLSQAKAQHALNTNAKQTARVKSIANKLIAQAKLFRPDAKDWKWEVNVINSKEVNAWCMPGGKIAVYTGILNTLNLNDDEVAVVLGHEIAHALREHSREQASQEVAKQGALQVASLFGVKSSNLAIADQLSTIGVMLPFSRTHETESDEIGLELAYKAGFNIDKGILIWEKMKKLSGSQPGLLDSLLSTHPSDDSRLENLKALSEKLKSEGSSLK